MIPHIKPIKEIQYELKQSKYDIVGKLPTRSLILAPSGSGKTVLLQNMILNIYKNCFERIYIWSPSINVDTMWLPVKQYIKEHLKVDNDKEKIYFDDYKSEELDEVITTQKEIIQYMKDKEYKNLYQILIVVDDFSDDPKFSRNSKLLHSLFTRGRHIGISTIVSSQKAAAQHPIIRVNATEYYIFKLRNTQDLEMIITELGAILPDKKMLMEIYRTATEKIYDFLYVNLRAKNINNMFFINYEKKITIE
jgi:hypothetical protein